LLFGQAGWFEAGSHLACCVVMTIEQRKRLELPPFEITIQDAYLHLLDGGRVGVANIEFNAFRAVAELILD